MKSVYQLRQASAVKNSQPLLDRLDHDRCAGELVDLPGPCDASGVTCAVAFSISQVPAPRPSWTAERFNGMFNGGLSR